MMWPERAMGLGVFIAVTAMALVLVLPSMSPPPEPLRMELRSMSLDSVRADAPTGSGDALVISDFYGPEADALYAEWNDGPILVIRVDDRTLALSAAVHGERVTEHAMPIPAMPGTSLLAYSAKSTHLGCTVAFIPDWEVEVDNIGLDYDGDGDWDGIFMDPCSQSIWDPFNRGEKAFENMPARGPLFPLALSIASDGTLMGTAIADD